MLWWQAPNLAHTSQNASSRESSPVLFLMFLLTHQFSVSLRLNAAETPVPATCRVPENSRMAPASKNLMLTQFWGLPEGRARPLQSLRMAPGMQGWDQGQFPSKFPLFPPSWISVLEASHLDSSFKVPGVQFPCPFSILTCHLLLPAYDRSMSASLAACVSNFRFHCSPV